jgi:hypothetical protein
MPDRKKMHWNFMSLRIDDEERAMVERWLRNDPDANSLNVAVRRMIRRATMVGVEKTEDGGVRPRKGGESE